MGKLEGLEEENMQQEAEEKVVSMEEHKKRAPYHTWEVAGREYKLKLNTGMIKKLENKYQANVLSLVSGNIPPLTVMLTIIQAAASPYNRGVTSYADVEKLYDAWLEEGGSQMGLLTDVVMPTMAVSGFFTNNQAESMMNNLGGIDDLL